MKESLVVACIFSSLVGNVAFAGTYTVIEIANPSLVTAFLLIEAPATIATIGSTAFSKTRLI